MTYTLDPGNGRTSGEPRHWLDGVRCPACRMLNASWLTYTHDHGPTVECEHCGETVRVIEPDDHHSSNDVPSGGLEGEVA